ncbi:MAG: acyl-CoA dehydratase activase [Prolixibacteraceae bacterium]
MQPTSLTTESVCSNFNLGIDIGSISVNTVILDCNGQITDSRYDFCHGRPFNVLRNILADLSTKIGIENIGLIAFTGTGGKQASEMVGGSFINEIISQSTSVSKLYPEVKTIIEMGGEDSKLIFMEHKEVTNQSQLSDFALNTLCAAGTGSFLDQQAKRIGVSIVDEFGELSLKSKNPPRIAGRCSVFAKSDMIHLQQVATPLHDIVAGLCFAVARNFKSTLGRGKKFHKPVIFQGGVAANVGMIRAFEEVLELEKGELIIPEHHASMGAIGAVMLAIDHPSTSKKFIGLDALDQFLAGDKTDKKYLPPLKESNAVYNRYVTPIPEGTKEKYPVYLGIDVGSLSTNVVLIDEKNNVIARRYLPTASKPIDAIRRGLKEIDDEVGMRVEVKSAGTTGSGRYLTGDFIGADTIQNEITAQATAAIAYDPTVDTIFEIGGQDSKYIRIENGVVVDFEMNKVCAAGTGSFLEEQAEKLDINIVNEFGNLALSSHQPCKLGDRCTVFMESDLNSHQQKGEARENLVGGLAYSIVHNYIRKVVGTKPVGNKIFFQGGVTNNKSVVAAFEEVTGKKIIIPPHYDVTGAIGAAILSRNLMKPDAQSRFKGFGVSKLPYSLRKFTCKHCSNDCEVQMVKIEGEAKPLYFGGRCDRWEVADRKGKGKDIPNLFEERLKFLVGDYVEEPQRNQITIGIPRGLMLYYQQFPFWRTFFQELGFRIVVSDVTDSGIVTNSIESIVTETCFPVEVMHGHINNLLEKKVDFVFTPFIVNAKAATTNPTSNCNCPWIQSYPFMVKGAMHNNPLTEKLLVPTLHFRFSEKVIRKELAGFMKEKFGTPSSSVQKAFKKADEAQISFERTVAQRGAEVMANLPKDKKAMVIIGRPYNSADTMLNLNLVEKLINMDILPIPLDYLPLHTIDVFKDYPRMYWPNGQKILAASKIVNQTENLYAVYLSNFRCGPDSFLHHFVRDELKSKPYLLLEVDEHSADAGLLTRCEAFLDSLDGYRKLHSATKQPASFQMIRHFNDDRTIYFPYMRDAAYAVSAAVRSCGIQSEVLPMTDDNALELARKYTSSQECFPLTCTTGSFLQKLMEPGIDPKKVAFFMPDHNGPCRFGQYNQLQRKIFDRLGFQDAEIISPGNDDSYETMAAGKSTKFRFTAWKGMIAVDLLRKMQQERRPYEAIKGMTDQIYHQYLDEVIRSLETGANNLNAVLSRSALAFKNIPIVNGYRKPVIPVIGEVFMRDNPFCNGYVVQRLEDLGAETFMAPMAEWISYSTYRYWRDSIWKSDFKGLFKSKLQELSQHISQRMLNNRVAGVAELDRDLHLHEMLEACGTYVHKHYDGDPPLAMGAAVNLTKTNISGIANILPFTCMPGTLITSVSHLFRKDHDNIPWENIAYDGQDTINIDTRLQAFMHQAHQYCKEKGYDKARVWH